MSDKILGVEVYPIDPQTVRSWCGWRGVPVTGKLEAGAHCNSLALRKYLVVGTYVKDHVVSERVQIYFSGNRGEVREFLNRNHFENGFRVEGAAVQIPTCVEVEVWHIEKPMKCAVCGEYFFPDRMISMSCVGIRGSLCLDCCEDLHTLKFIMQQNFKRYYDSDPCFVWSPEGRFVTAVGTLEHVFVEDGLTEAMRYANEVAERRWKVYQSRIDFHFPVVAVKADEYDSDIPF